MSDPAGVTSHRSYAPRSGPEGTGAALHIVGRGIRRATRVHGGVKIPMQIPVPRFP